MAAKLKDRPNDVSSRVNMRAPAGALAIIDRAAKAEHMDRTTFMLAASLERAREKLLDQALFVLDETEWDRVVNAPTEPNAAALAFAAERDPWAT